MEMILKFVRVATCEQTKYF